MAPYLMKAGERFGKLRTVRQVENSERGHCWLCECDCGGEKVGSVGVLRQSKNISCGCNQHGWPLIVAGERFGKLVTVREVENTTKRSGRIWLCK